MVSGCIDFPKGFWVYRLTERFLGISIIGNVTLVYIQSVGASVLPYLDCGKVWGQNWKLGWVLFQWSLRSVCWWKETLRRNWWGTYLSWGRWCWSCIRIQRSLSICICGRLAVWGSPLNTSLSYNCRCQLLIWWVSQGCFP